MSKNSSDASACTPLPDGFVPGEHDVVIGKGKKFYFHTGNQWLRTLVSSMLDEYKQAQTKSDKSNIISDVVEYVRQNGRFVKRDLKTGKWVFAEPLLCREKCSQTFRDNLAETYRSSNVAKRNKRRAEQQEKKRVPDTKRMRLHAPSASAMQQVQQQQVRQVQQQQQQQPAPIPSNLFDLEMPLWSPKNQTVALLPNSLDFGALTRGSITGTAGNNQHHHHQDNTGGAGLNFNLNFQSSSSNNNTSNNHVAPAPAPNTNTNSSSTAPTFNLSGLSSMNLLQNLPDILNNLQQIANGNMSAPAPAPSATTGGADNLNNQVVAGPFDPAPLNNGLPPLTGGLDPAAAIMPSLDTANIFEPRPIGTEKRHSLALGISDLDWLKANVQVGALGGVGAANNSNPSATDPEQQQTQTPQISAAFAA